MNFYPTRPHSRFQNCPLPFLLALAVSISAHSASHNAPSSHPGLFDFGKLTRSTSGGEFVEVNIQSNLISMASRLTKKMEPDVAELLGGLNRIRVNVIGMKDDNRDAMEKRVQEIRAELDAAGWERVVTVQKEKEDVGVYMKTRGPEAIEGLVVTVINKNREAVFVNIVGDLRPEKIAAIGEKFNIEPLKTIGPVAKKEKVE